MEVLLEAASGIPPDAVVSLRLGPTRRQAPLQSALSHPLRFTTTLDDACEPLRVDVMRPLASARVVLRAEELRYSVPLEGKQDMALRLKVKPAKVAEREKGGEPAGKLFATLKDVTAGAKDYLEHHKILQYMQALLHAVIQAKPLDPFSFMVAQLTSARSRPSRSQRSRRGSCPGSLAKDSSTQLDLQPEIELASDPGPLPPSSVPSMTPFEVFSDPGQTRKASGPPSTAACPAPTEDAVPACHPDPEETEASLAGQRQEPEEPAPEGTGVLGDEELECLRGSLRRQLEEAVDEGKLASAVERAVALMSGQEDDEVRTRRELVQLQEEQKELRLRSERLKQDLRDLRRVNLDLRRQLMALKPLEVDGLPGAVLGADSCG